MTRAARPKRPWPRRSAVRARRWCRTRARAWPRTLRRARAFIARRAAGEPLAYLTGRREFWSLDLRVTPDVLVPRPETELVVERVLALGGPGRRQFADLGTGSGAIALAVGRERPGWTILATDVSEAALAVARYNAAQLAMAHVEFALGSWFEACAGRRFELIASNPPYVAGDDHALGSRTLRHEPRAALTPGGDGLAAIDALVDGAPTHLVAGGWIVLEHGATQAADVAARLVARGFGRVRSAPDLAGHLRVTEGQWT